MIYKLLNKASRSAAIRAIEAAPDGWVVRITDATRSLDQNALLHSELQEISENIKWAGEFRSIDDWKRLLTAAWMRATDKKAVLLPAVDGIGFDVLYYRTSSMTKEEMSELIDYIHSWKSERTEFNHAIS